MEAFNVDADQEFMDNSGIFGMELIDLLLLNGLRSEGLTLSNRVSTFFEFDLRLMARYAFAALLLGDETAKGDSDEAKDKREKLELARSIFARYLSRNDNQPFGNESWRDLVIDYLSYLRKSGVRHPGFAEVERLMRFR